MNVNFRINDLRMGEEMSGEKEVRGQVRHSRKCIPRLFLWFWGRISS